NMYSLTIVITGDGTTLPTEGQHLYVENTLVDLAAYPAEGWDFQKWIINGVDVFEPFTSVLMDGDKVIAAYFFELPPEPPLPAIAIFPADQAVDIPVAFTFEWAADPDGVIPDGYLFNYWLADGEQPEMIDVGINTEYSVEGLDYLAEYNWQVVPYVIVENGTIGLLFSERRTRVVSETRSVRETYYLYAENCPVWTFTTEELIIEYTLTVNIVGEGTTEPAAGQHIYTENTIVNLAAYPAEGWDFEKWFVDGAEIFDPFTTLLMDGDKIVTAHFFELPPEPPLPAIALYPIPVAENIPVEFIFAWEPNEAGNVPDGYFFSYWLAQESQPEMIDLGNVTTYPVADLLYETSYNWQVIPYVMDGDEILFAADCPVWSFTTEIESFGVFVEIGTGTGVNRPNQQAPINLRNASLRGQMVYTAAEINAAGYFGEGLVTHLGFYVEESPLYPLPDFIIRMKHTTAIDASSHDAGPYETVFTTVEYIPEAGGWDMLELPAPFAWNGVDNILVDTAFSLATSWSNSGRQRITDQSNGYRFTGSNNADQTNATTTSTFNFKPNVRLGINFIPARGSEIALEGFQIEETMDVLPAEGMQTRLLGAYPNPFNPETNINFSLSEAARVTMIIYNSRGQVVRELLKGHYYSEGYHSILWDGKEQYGRMASSGVYLYIMETDRGFREIRKKVLLK
ncbi:MAG: hypothetical protein K0B81_02230, partial [Candidatus Cloacimonetes bacterium]|nr:hypothetical protein [Candidatus Cloacimonadota bacterium]